jgi:hypothetical protein
VIDPFELHGGSLSSRASPDTFHDPASNGSLATTLLRFARIVIETAVALAALLAMLTRALCAVR